MKRPSFDGPLPNPSHAIYCLLKVRRIKFDPEVLTIAKRRRGAGAAAARERVKNELTRQCKTANQWSQSCDGLLRRMQLIAAEWHVENICDGP
jgi:hypothetical protein